MPKRKKSSSSKRKTTAKQPTRKNDGSIVEDPLLFYLKKQGLKYIDLRDRHGCLWIIGGLEISKKIKPLQKSGVSISFKPGGSTATREKDAWWTTDRPANLSLDVEDPLLSYLKKQGLKYIDLRDRHGCLWIIGGLDLSKKIRPLQKNGVSIFFKAGGSTATRKKDAWWTTDKLDNLSLDEEEDIQEQDIPYQDVVISQQQNEPAESKFDKSPAPGSQVSQPEKKLFEGQEKCTKVKTLSRDDLIHLAMKYYGMNECYAYQSIDGFAYVLVERGEITRIANKNGEDIWFEELMVRYRVQSPKQFLTNKYVSRCPCYRCPWHEECDIVAFAVDAFENKQVRNSRTESIKGTQRKEGKDSIPNEKVKKESPSKSKTVISSSISPHKDRAVTTTGITVSFDSMYIKRISSATRTKIASGGNVSIIGGNTTRGTFVSSGNSVYVKSGGTAINTTVMPSYIISRGNNATKTIVSSGGSAYIKSDGTAINTAAMPSSIVSRGNTGTIVSSGGSVYIKSSGTAINTTVMPNYLVSIGNNATGTIISSGSSVYVKSGGTAINTTVMSGGFLSVSSGGTATSATLMSGGTLMIWSGGKALNTTITSGGHLTIWSGGRITHAGQTFAYNNKKNAYDSPLAPYNPTGNPNFTPSEYKEPWSKTDFFFAILIPLLLLIVITLLEILK